jgi:glutamyl-tRNA synthetase
MRAAALASGKPPRYNGYWRDKPESAAPDGVVPVVRFKAPQEGKTVIDDITQGTVELNNEQLDDMILLRADGTPTYMLSVVVDDHDMGITHIIRGDDHLTNAFRQYHLYKACGWDVPRFAHIPLIYGPDGAKLSKRHGAVGAEQYRKMGFLPEALKNYLVRLGWAHGDDEIMSMSDAVEWFDVANVVRSPARFDTAKLMSLNAHYIRESSNERLLQEIREMLLERYTKPQDEAFLEGLKRIARGMDGLKVRAKTLCELAESAMFYISAPTFDEEDSLQAAGKKEEFSASLAMFLECIEPLSESFDGALEESIRDFCKKRNVSAVTERIGGREHRSTGAELRLRTAQAEQRRAPGKVSDFVGAPRDEPANFRGLGISIGALLQPVRIALTGRKVSPNLFEVMTILGKEEVVKRVMAYINA